MDLKFKLQCSSVAATLESLKSLLHDVFPLLVFAILYMLAILVFAILYMAKSEDYMTCIVIWIGIPDHSSLSSLCQLQNLSLNYTPTMLTGFIITV